MEGSNRTLEGHAMVIDTPVDAMRSFVSKFNEALRSRFREGQGDDVEYIADVTEVQRVGPELVLRWQIRKNQELHSGTARYNMDADSMLLT